MKNKFVNIEIAGESGNIGVIGIGILGEGGTSTRIAIRERLEPKLVEALSQHFDCEVKIVLVDVISVLAPIEIRVTVVLCTEEEDRQEEVVLNETWIY